VLLPIRLVGLAAIAFIGFNIPAGVAATSQEPTGPWSVVVHDPSDPTGWTLYERNSPSRWCWILARRAPDESSPAKVCGPQPGWGTHQSLIEANTWPVDGEFSGHSVLVGKLAPTLATPSVKRRDGKKLRVIRVGREFVVLLRDHARLSISSKSMKGKGQAECRLTWGDPDLGDFLCTEWRTGN
jgi:hypothetical protein